MLGWFAEHVFASAHTSRFADCWLACTHIRGFFQIYLLLECMIESSICGIDMFVKYRHGQAQKGDCTKKVVV